MTTTHPVARAALSLLLCAPAIAWTVDLLAGTPALILAAATAPAALLAILILVAQQGAHRPPAALAFAFFWGAAGAAFLSTTGNELSRTWIDPLSGGEARATALVVAPVLEEAAKVLGLVFLLVVAPASLRTARDGIVYGALVGVGFVWTENFLYLGVAMLQAGQEGLVRALYLRGILGGITHAVFAACSGAAVGWWVSGGRCGKAAPVSGVLLAIGQHMAWNAGAAPLIATALCGAVVAGGACTDAPTDAAVYGLATGIAAVFLAPGFALAAFAWRAADA